MDHTLPITQRLLTPTDLSQFLHLDRCERFLRLRMYERENGRRFLYDFHVLPQELPPILGRTGELFEKAIVDQLGQVVPLLDFSTQPLRQGQKRLRDNTRFVARAGELAPGTSLLIAQPRLELSLGRFQVRGDADLVLLSRDAAGKLSVLVIDVKSSTRVKVQHRLQVAFYARMLEDLLPEATVETAILYRGPALGGTAEETPELIRDRAAIQALFGPVEGYLERIAHLDSYKGEIESLVSGKTPVAERVATRDVRDLVFALSPKCDGCLYNEYCMKKAFEDEDLSLLPYLSARDKKALWRAGIRTVTELAGLKEETTVNGKVELAPAPGKEAALRALASTSVGVRVDELVLRARRRLRLSSLTYVPHRGHSSLPASTPELHPNLIRIYMDIQEDFIQDRVFMLGALVVANENGEPVRRRHIVHLTDAPPDGPQKEADLFADWIVDTLRAVVELAAGNEAPIHLIFWSDSGQRTLLDALARNLPPMVRAAPALYDFVTQLAAYDSPVATFLAEEIRQHKLYPPVCPSLPILAGYLKFDWSDPDSGDLYNRVFHQHLFDISGKLDDGTPYTRRSRHNSQIPLEYIYAAWNELPAPPPQGEDPYQPYRDVTRDQILGFERKRLDAIEHIASDLKPDEIIRKASFKLPELSLFEDRATHLAAAIGEFLTMERHTYLAGWRSIRNLPPERRALAGATLLVSYQDSDQPDGGAFMRDCRERHRLYEEWRGAHPGGRRSSGVMEATKWSFDDAEIYLRVETAGTDTDLETLLGMQTAKDGEQLVCCPRWTDYGQPQPYTPTPKQLLYGMRVRLLELSVTRDADGKATSAFAIVTGGWNAAGAKDGYTFWGAMLPFEDGALYTLDEDPNDIMGSRMKKLADALCEQEKAGQPEVHGFYYRVSRNDLTTPACWPEAAAVGQKRFLDGLQALHTAGIAYAFEPSKRAYIGEHGGDPLLLVQGPPGTGKSFSTGFAVLARIQGAMAAGIRQRVFLSCKTHSATDVLLKGVVEALATLAEWRQQAPDLFAAWFDPRLLAVETFRLGRMEEGRDGGSLPGSEYLCAAGTPAALAKLAPAKTPFGSDLCDLLVLDEASQMSLPEALLASLPLASSGRVVVVGDPRQMPPIVHHAWDQEPRRTFQYYPTYLSLFDFLLSLKPPLIQFAESFRLHSVMADFLREEVYRHDGIPYHSRKKATLLPVASENPLVSAALSPDYPLIVVVHEEAESQTRNAYEELLLGPLLRALSQDHGFDPRHGFGVVVPHRAQRIALRMAHPQLCLLDENGKVTLAAVDTVERYQGDEREVVIISATESDPDYIQASAGFLLDPRRLTVALSRAKRKMILVASRSIFEHASVDEETFENALIWKNLLRRACTVELFHGVIENRAVTVYGCPIPATEGNDHA